jgi:hypothetical protein
MGQAEEQTYQIGLGQKLFIDFLDIVVFGLL